MSRTFHDHDEYTRRHHAHSARTRNQRRYTPEADLTVTQELPISAMLATPAQDWPAEALERLLAEVRS